LLAPGGNRRKKKKVSKDWSVALWELVEQLTHNLEFVGSNTAIDGSEGNSIKRKRVLLFLFSTSNADGGTIIS